MRLKYIFAVCGTVCVAVCLLYLAQSDLVAPLSSVESGQQKSSRPLRGKFDNWTQIKRDFLAKEVNWEKPVPPIPYLNDQTIALDWDKTVDRVFLKDEKDGKRPQILLTNYGWNHPNQTKGLQFQRSYRSRLLLRGIINHPWFHPRGWENYLAYPSLLDEETRYYIFLDVETCFEAIWPLAGYNPWHLRYEINCETAFNRTLGNRWNSPCSGFGKKGCPMIHEALDAPILSNPNINATMVLFNCNCLLSHPRSTMELKRRQGRTNIAVASYSAATTYTKNQHLVAHERGDQGLVALPFNFAVPNPQQLDEMERCDETSRDLFLTFAGNFRSEARQALHELHDPDHGVYIVENTKEVNGSSYDEFLFRSNFGLAPHGDCHYSYRFAEVVAAGAIPVVHSDGWLLPFRPEVADWDECLIRIPENKANITVDILRGISLEKRCKMRKKCREIYTKYMSSNEAIISGIVEGLEASFQSGVDIFGGWPQNLTTIEKA